MSFSSISINRRLLQMPDLDPLGGVSDHTALSPDIRRVPFNTAAPFDSAMAITIFAILTSLFFIGFFSIYIRRFTSSESESEPNHYNPTIYKSHAGGLDPSAINSLPVVPYRNSNTVKQRMIDDCPICLTEFQENDNVKLIPYCGHVFHPKCLDTWLISHVTCPFCRSSQLFFSRVAEVRLNVDICVDLRHVDTCTGQESSSGLRKSCSCSKLSHANPALRRSKTF